MAVVGSLSEAFENSLVYFLRNNTVLDDYFSTRVYMSTPDTNLSNLTVPFIVLKNYLKQEEIFAAPQMAGNENKLVIFNLSIGIYCETFAQQRYLPELVRKEINASVVGTTPGIQIYSGWTAAAYDVGTELYVADLDVGDIYPLGGETEEDITRKFRSFIDATSSVMKDFSKVFITT